MESATEDTQHQQQQGSQRRRKNNSKTYQYGPYCDAPQSLGFKATISAPHMHAKALDLLAEHLLRSRDVGGGIECGFRALDVGSGSGVLVALFARILRGIAVADTAHTAAEDVAASSDGTTGITEQRRSIVVGIEVVPELVQTSINNLRRDGFHPNDHENGASEHSNQELAQHRARSDPQIVVRQGNGWSAGTAEGSAAAEFGPFDVIHVGAAAPGPGIPPGLKQLLKPGGRMILPIGARGAQQRWTMVDRSVSEQYSMMSISGVRFVPLVEDV
jgi:protein-L-isoaspartate(D-aspartate) O-methyltransferase